ncbi:MAG: FHA domain-containing protein [Chloroflexi bacterium]|nr:FHA domain-containing protein [Ardenticatenaceae bacterium]MBL1129229.1 FHA domain-containing protein [Chloroflexota bacterium]NOG35304.1 FHA domain-containing protein [Chloroflexota bacterium]GIK58583.1 MAG: phosphopeptide-binding protein [Chloroflexota bacterium]
MDLAVLLLGLRMISALLLVGFVALLAWFIYRDMRLTAASLAAEGRPSGVLRVIANESGEVAPDTLFPLLPVTSIGRASSNTIVLSDGFTSSEHVLITRRNGQWWLQDQGSRNGTYLNETPVVGTAVVSPGDIITVGGTRLKIEF